MFNIPTASRTRSETASNADFQKGVNSVLREIEKAKAAGKYQCNFYPYCNGDYYDSIKALFQKHGYTFRPTGYVGGVWQTTENICW